MIIQPDLETKKKYIKTYFIVMTVCFIFYANLTPNYSCYLNLWNLCQFSVSLFEASFSVLFLCQVILAGYFDWPVKMVAESQIARSHHVQSFLCPNQKLSFYLHRPRYKILLPMFSAGSPCCDAFTNLYFGYRSLTFFGKAYLLILTDYCKFYIDLKTGKSLQLHYNQFFFYYISFRILQVCLSFLYNHCHPPSFYQLLKNIFIFEKQPTTGHFINYFFKLQSKDDQELNLLSIFSLASFSIRIQQTINLFDLFYQSTFFKLGLNFVFMEISSLEIFDFQQNVNVRAGVRVLMIFEQEIVDLVSSSQEIGDFHLLVRTQCNRQPTYRFTFHILPLRVIMEVYTILWLHNQLNQFRLFTSQFDVQNQNRKFLTHFWNQLTNSMVQCPYGQYQDYEDTQDPELIDKLIFLLCQDEAHLGTFLILTVGYSPHIRKPDIQFLFSEMLTSFKQYFHVTAFLKFQLIAWSFFLLIIIHQSL